jgi:hypothetical protein
MGMGIFRASREESQALYENLSRRGQREDFEMAHPEDSIELGLEEQRQRFSRGQNKKIKEDGRSIQEKTHGEHDVAFDFDLTWSWINPKRVGEGGLNK